MDSKAMINAYVDDVMRHLPGRKRKDVGAELQALLRDEVAGREADSGRAADEAMTLDVLRNFGAPGAVAERYREAGPVIIRGVDARRFAMWAFGGVLLQWAASLPLALNYLPRLDPLSRLGAWWMSEGLGAFWWPGVMVTAATIGAFVRDARSAQEHWKPVTRAALDPDRVKRGTMAALMTLFVFAVLFAVALPAALANLPEPFRHILALDPSFLTQRAPLALAGWAAQFAVYVVVFRAGRWSRLAHRLNVAIEAGWIGIMLWFVFGGPMMVAPNADATAKAILLLLALIYVVAVALKLRRELIRVPAQPVV